MIKQGLAGTAKSYSLEESKGYEKKITAELDLAQQRIVDLRTQAITGASQNKRLLSLAANNIQMEKMASQNELIALESAPKAAWGAQKVKVDKALEELGKAW